MRIRKAAAASLAVALSLGIASTASAQFYKQTNLASDLSEFVNPPDSDLVNAWGLAASSSSPWWVADNGTDKSTLYNGNTGAKQGLVVSVAGAPTGVVFAPAGSFGTARFIFATESGTILAWSGGNAATLVAQKAGAIYKGLAITVAPRPLIYATNFHAGTVDVFDSTFSEVTVSGGFRDATIPDGYAPFGIQSIDGTIYVTYALQDAEAEDDVAGEGHGFVNAFDTSGNLLRRVASGGDLNSPWGVALAPSNFGKFSGDLLVGNFGDGRIHAFVPTSAGEFDDHGPLHSTQGRPIEIDGLWALQFGNGAAAGPTNTLFFTAGPFEEGHGLFGRLDVAAAPGKDR
jgi:uncharacterized protein (TIGR03118 family)